MLQYKGRQVRQRYVKQYLKPSRTRVYLYIRRAYNNNALYFKKMEKQENFKKSKVQYKYTGFRPDRREIIMQEANPMSGVFQKY